ncbi:FAD dependent oxidoreductase-like protein superfamily [Delitschia confertaspora ATCC 74209]|uniref:FAD dependent oxidoreductase-like protein superfamily n=1 Tax=Delitschia confertaspora ATCC 74209 TaxID=1513339 RepID=A0A9P4JU49_9PLEO|nr:FAD dependent oxidoreductase-like protein superfamily [Delitschia confertaspora ATCC 74209]
MADTVILGSGIIGLSTAYYLSQSPSSSPHRIHLVDASPKLFHCASGFAGGFLAADWFAPSVAGLGSLSFKLHKELAEKHNGRKSWGYGLSTGTSLSQNDEDSEEAVGGSGEDFLSNGTSRAQAAGAVPSLNSNGPVWLKRTEGGSLEVISKENSTAQIDPLRFCKFLLDQCLSRGVQVHYPAKALSVSRDQNNRLSGIRISQNGVETELSCTRLIITAGAWSPKVFSTLFPKATTRIPITPLAGHSLLLRNPFFKPDEEEVCHAVFATDTLGFSPELFSRLDGEIYIAGLNTTQIPLPEIPTDAKVTDAALKQLKHCADTMLGLADSTTELQVLRSSLCFRPVTSSGRPIISRIADEKLGDGLLTRGGGEGGVFVAAGHGAWGISQAPGTGLCCAELVEGRKTSADIAALALL